jgi:tetratricopeptide (TPR) repeat protein
MGIRKSNRRFEYSFIINPEFESGYLDCADTCLQIRNYEKALEIYIEANNKFGPNNELMVNIAHCYIYLNRIGIAKQWLLKAIKLDGYNDEAFFLLGECYSRDQVWYNAINAYHKAIELENRREEYYLGLAKAYLAVEDYNKATVNFQMATQTGPEDTLYWKEYICFLIKWAYLTRHFRYLMKQKIIPMVQICCICRAVRSIPTKKISVIVWICLKKHS